VGVDNRAKGIEVVETMLPEEAWPRFIDATKSNDFAAFLRDIALRNVFGEIWSREGLDRRSRSLLTLGMLIAQQNAVEIAAHTVNGMRNGLTVSELEEILYHASAYLGFPATNIARNAMDGALDRADAPQART
jgi:4-carboxymuconolactone decarboxylase